MAYLERSYEAALREIDSLKAENARLQEIVGKLPVDALGNCIIPSEDAVYHPEWDCPARIDVVSAAYGPEDYEMDEEVNWIAVAGYYESDTGYSDQFCKPASECYLSEQAALAAGEGEKNQ